MFLGGLLNPTFMQTMNPQLGGGPALNQPLQPSSPYPHPLLLHALLGQMVQNQGFSPMMRKGMTPVRL